MDISMQKTKACSRKRAALPVFTTSVVTGGYGECCCPQTWPVTPVYTLADCYLHSSWQLPTVMNVKAKQSHWLSERTSSDAYLQPNSTKRNTQSPASFPLRTCITQHNYFLLLQFSTVPIYAYLVQNPTTSLQGVTTHKTLTCIFTAVKSSDLASRTARFDTRTYQKLASEMQSEIPNVVVE